MGQIRVEEAASLEHYLANEAAGVKPEDDPIIVNGVQLGYPAKEGDREEEPPFAFITVTRLIWDDSALTNGEAIYDGKQWNFNPDPVINQPPGGPV